MGEEISRERHIYEVKKRLFIMGEQKADPLLIAGRKAKVNGDEMAREDGSLD